jgi:hypothetical protein
VGPEVEHGGHVRVAEARERQRLFAQPAARLRIQPVAGQHFDRDIPAEVRVLRQEHDPHAPDAKGLFKMIVGECASNACGGHRPLR